MLTNGSFRQTEAKLKRLARLLADRMFQPVGRAALETIYQTNEPIHHIPDDARFTPVGDTAQWGGDGVYAWFKTSYTVPESLAGQALFLYPRMGFYEATLWLNGRIHSNYAAKFVEGSHGNHYCNRITRLRPGRARTFDFALEGYAYHDMPGTQPLSDERRRMNFELCPWAAVDVCRARRRE